MLEQTNQSVKFLAFFTASKVGKSGISVTIDVWNPASSQIVTGASATALGGGLYYYVLASGSVTTTGEYAAIFHTTDSTVDQKDIPSLWVCGRNGCNHLDADTSSRAAIADYTSGRAAKLDNLTSLDVAVSSRAAIADYTSARAVKLDNLDATISSRLATTVTAIADAVLKRGTVNTETSADARSLTELILAALNSSLSGTTLTVKKSDSTTFATHTVSTDATAAPVVGVS